MTLSYTDGAIADLTDALDWYEERNPGAAYRLQIEAELLVQRIVDAPQHFPRIDHRFRHAVMSSFPYRIVFAANLDSILITAFAHTSRKPDYWRHR